MNKKYFQIFNYGSLGLIIIFLVLMILNAVPTGWFAYLLGISIMLFAIRIIMRIYFTIKSRKKV